MLGPTGCQGNRAELTQTPSRVHVNLLVPFHIGKILNYVINEAMFCFARLPTYPPAFLYSRLQFQEICKRQIQEENCIKNLARRRLYVVV